MVGKILAAPSVSADSTVQDDVVKKNCEKPYPSPTHRLTFLNPTASIRLAGEAKEKIVSLRNVDLFTLCGKIKHYIEPLFICLTT